MTSGGRHLQLGQFRQLRSAAVDGIRWSPCPSKAAGSPDLSHLSWLHSVEVQLVSPRGVLSALPAGRSAVGPIAVDNTEWVTSSGIRWVGVAIDCADAGPVARFYERLLGFEVRDFQPPHWAQLWDPAGGVHLNVQGESWYTPPTWPEQPGEQAKMLHFEVEVDDLEAAVATVIAAGGQQARWQPSDRDPTRIRVVLDPAGHPLCLFVRGE